MARLCKLFNIINHQRNENYKAQRNTTAHTLERLKIKRLSATSAGDVVGRMELSDIRGENFKSGTPHLENS